MGGHIRIDKDLEDDPRVFYLAEKTLDHWESIGVPKVLREAMWEPARNAVLGSLYRLWRYGDTHLTRHDLLNLALQGVSSVTGVPPAVLRQFPPQWLHELPDGNVELPGYSDKNALMDKDKRREKTRERVRRWRLEQRKKVEGGNALPKREGNTSERHHSVTTGPGPGTGTGTNPPTRDRDRPETENREPQTPPRAPLASAQGHLAAQSALSRARTGRYAHTRTLDELKAAALEVAERTGSNHAQVARALGDSRATPELVKQWLEEPSGEDGRAEEGTA